MALSAGPARGALTAGELLLVANRNVPQGVELARYYAEQRSVPADQLLLLDLPTGDDIGMDNYELKLADAVREWLASNPQKGVRCAVTFFGVPYKIAPRAKSPEADREQQLLEAHQRQIEPKLNACAIEIERLVREVDPSFVPAEGKGMIGTVARIRQAATAAVGAFGRLQGDPKREQIEQSWARLSAAMEAPVSLDESTTQVAMPGESRVNIDFAAGRLRIGDPGTRAAIRSAARKQGVVRYAQVIDAQLDYLAYGGRDAAVDNELACAAWGQFRRENWQGNPLNYAAPAGASAPPTLMVMRLDGPGAEVVRRIIDDSIATERAGLKGRVLLDAWNKPLKKPDGQVDGYGQYDELIRRARALLGQKARLPIEYEATEQLVSENSQKDIAVYCGWYDPNQVVIPGTFARGAVGFHVASYTAVGLRSTGGGWWVPGLLQAGVCGTIGPVSEPYLSAFPNPEDFLPLLLCGKLTLAEVWWKTSPMTSWKMLAIGDPLYTPFGKLPALSVTDLPSRLQGAVR